MCQVSLVCMFVVAAVSRVLAKPVTGDVAIAADPGSVHQQQQSQLPALLEVGAQQQQLRAAAHKTAQPPSCNGSQAGAGFLHSAPLPDHTSSSSNGALSQQHSTTPDAAQEQQQHMPSRWATEAEQQQHFQQHIERLLSNGQATTSAPAAAAAASSSFTVQGHASLRSDDSVPYAVAAAEGSAVNTHTAGAVEQQGHQGSGHVPAVDSSSDNNSSSSSSTNGRGGSGSDSSNSSGDKGSSSKAHRLDRHLVRPLQGTAAKGGEAHVLLAVISSRASPSC
jgi:hypothetical protein